MTDWAERFGRFVERRERAAREAVLHPFVTEADNGGPGMIAIGSEWTGRLFDGAFYLSPSADDLPATSLVFVQSRDGNTGAADPSALGGGDTDKHLVYEGLARVAADGVLAGAETIRGGDALFSVWRDELVALRRQLRKPRHPVQIVATLRGLAFDDTLLYNVPDIPVVVLTVPGCAEVMRDGLAARPWIAPIVMAHQNDLKNAFRELRRRGIGRVSAVGGRTVATALVDAGLVQDIYLTTSAKPGGQPHTPFYPRPLETDLIVRKRGTGPEAGVTFEHRLLRQK